MKSMTGYGKYSVSAYGRVLSTEIKSVNHRFLDVALKNFKTFGFAEERVKKLIEASVSRGHVEVYINYSDERENAVSLLVDYNLIGEYLKSAEEIETRFGIKNDLSFCALMRNNDVFKEKFNEDDEEILLSLITECISAALLDLNAARIREGGLIKTDLTAKLNFVAGKVAEIEKRSPEVYAEYGKKLGDRIKEILDGVEVDENRLLNEAAFFADRAGIDEEIERLKIHIKNLFAIFESEEAVGRKMDFTLQEMNREINTIGSKANDIELANIVISVKTELEKIREQCQNIE
jgi:uncharacterized protein (TIGR00255 family)